MKKSVLLCAIGAGLLLSGCGYYGHPVNGYASYGEPYYYSGYYDDFYGPFDEGFWAPDGFFYYGDHDHHFHRGDAVHFRHDGAPGFHSFNTSRARLAGAPAARMSGSSAPQEHR